MSHTLVIYLISEEIKNCYILQSGTQRVKMVLDSCSVLHHIQCYIAGVEFVSEKIRHIIMACESIPLKMKKILARAKAQISLFIFKLLLSHK